MSRPTTPHPVSPARPRPLPGPKPAPQPRPSRMSLRFAIAEYVGIATCLIASIAIVTWFGRADLLVFTFLMTYLIVSLLAPARRPKSPRPAPSSGAATP